MGCLSLPPQQPQPQWRQAEETQAIFCRVSCGEGRIKTNTFIPSCQSILASKKQGKRTPFVRSSPHSSNCYSHFWGHTYVLGKVEAELVPCVFLFCLFDTLCSSNMQFYCLSIRAILWWLKDTYTLPVWDWFECFALIQPPKSGACTTKMLEVLVHNWFLIDQ